ncbi:MAG: hypothetical protein PWQ68_1648 [Thermoanaerobacteraceae bacterium]|nr:hypothetical protein [Thermoanaerobacteraceae bacterium]
MGKINVVQMGLGPIGNQITRFLAERKNFNIVGSIDADEKKVGQDVGTLAGLPEPIGVKVSKDIESVLKNNNVDAVILTTTSSLTSIREQIINLLEYGVNIVTTCEELSYPWLTNPEISREIDEKAKSKKVSVLATGVNPGFLMDFLPLSLTSVCRSVDKITVERIQDATFRRIPFQKKIGAGLSIKEFHEKVEKGILRHVGLTESIHMIASRLGWKLEKTEDIITPVVATRLIKTNNMTIQPGDVAGVQQVGRGIVDGQVAINLVFRASVGEPESRDSIIIEGTPRIESTIHGGVNGDIATCAIVVNSIPVVVHSRPGLRTMSDIETLSFFK